MIVLQKSATRVTKDVVLVDWQKKISNNTVTLSPGAVCTYVLVHGVSTLSERRIEFILGSESSLTIYGVMVGTNKQNLKLDIAVNHAEPGAQSHTQLRGIFSDNAHGELNGTIIIKPQAQRSNALLDERVLLLSDTAIAKTIPNLEIEADDVQATHSATVSSISADEVFYLQSRGIQPHSAQLMIVSGFLQHMLVALDQRTRDAMHQKILQKILGKKAGAVPKNSAPTGRRP